MSEEIKYNLAKDMPGLPTGGRGYSERYDALRAAAKSRRDLFDGSGRKNLHILGIKEGYSFQPGEGKTLVDTIQYRGGAYNEGGILNIYKDAEKKEETEEVVEEETTQEETEEEEVVDTGPDYNQMADDLMAKIPSISDITNAINEANTASENRIRAMNEENRKLYINDQRNRASEARTPNLQIRGAGETPRTAGSQGFRRRSDQFKIAPFQGISGALGVVGQVAQNKLVNI